MAPQAFVKHELNPLFDELVASCSSLASDLVHVLQPRASRTTVATTDDSRYLQQTPRRGEHSWLH